MTPDCDPTSFMYKRKTRRRTHYNILYYIMLGTILVNIYMYTRVLEGKSVIKRKKKVCEYPATRESIFWEHSTAQPLYSSRRTENKIERK